MALSRHLVYFSATESGNRDHGTWIAAVADAAAGAAYIAVQANIDNAVAEFGAGTLAVSTDAVTIPSPARVARSPGENWYYDPVAEVLQEDRLRPFPLRKAVSDYYSVAREVVSHIREFTGVFPPTIIDAALSAESWSYRWVHVIALKRIAAAPQGQPARMESAAKQALTNARLVSTIELMAVGPTEAVGRNNEERVRALLRTADTYVNGGGTLRPLVGPFGWVDPRTDPPTRVSLLQARDLSDRTGVTGLSGGRGLDLRVIDIDRSVDFSTDEWVSKINS